MNDGPEWFPDEVLVPDVVGLLVDDAREVAQTVGVVLSQPEADGPALSALTWRLPVIVTSQDPPAGTLIRRHHSVVVTWGSELGGVRAPRRPAPRSVSDVIERIRVRSLTSVSLEGPLGDNMGGHRIKYLE